MTDESKSTSRPLCVDLDGTLVKTDTFAQALLLLISTRPGVLFLIPKWASAGLASFKKRVAKEVQLDPAALPMQTEFLQFLKQEHAQGRSLILATASDESVARRIAGHLGIFSEVLASDGVTNLRAERKRDALIARFGENNFDYAGNASDDLPVWDVAREIIAVNPCGPVRRALRGKSVRLFEDRPAKWKAWLDALRVHQWTKNTLVFLPMVLAHELTTPDLYLKAGLAFIAFSFAASAIYVFNDLFDLHADQHHPRKQARPFAAGNLSLPDAVVMAPLLVLAALATACLLGAAFVGVLLFYLLLTTLYSWRLKQIALLDVITLAGFYTLRILAGTAAYGVETSTWLLGFSVMLFCSLALVKRYAELREEVEVNPGKIGVRGRGYQACHLPWLARVGRIAGILSTVVLGFYITSEKVVQFYKTPAALWFLCPLVLYWIARIWRLAATGRLSDDPLDFAARDPQTWVIGALGILVLILGAVF